MHRKCASDSAVPGLGLLAAGHQVLPVSLKEAAYVIVPAKEYPPPLLLHHEIVECQVDHVHPGVMLVNVVIKQQTIQLALESSW